MGRRKREPMDPAKKNIVSELIKTYDIKTPKDIQEALKDIRWNTTRYVRGWNEWAFRIWKIF